MAFTTTLKLAAAALGLTTVGHVQQDPSFDYQLAVPHNQDQVSATSTSFDQQEATATTDSQVKSDKTVSVHFRSAKVGEVLDWLQSEGVSFIVKDADLKEKTVSLNIKDQPIDEVMDALAEVLGGEWNDHHGIKVFTSEKPAIVFGGPSGVNARAFKKSRDSINFPAQPDFPVMPDVPFDNQAFTQQFNDPKFKSDMLKMQKNMEKMSKDLVLNFKADKLKSDFDSEKFAKEFTKNFNPEVFTKSFSKGFGSTNSFNFQTTNVDQFVKSLTTKQKALHKKQGYLKVSDLSSAQKNMLGISKNSGRYEMRYTKDKQSIVVKSN